MSRRPGSHLTSTLDENMEQNRLRGLMLCTWETLRREAVSPGYGSPKLTIPYASVQTLFISHHNFSHQGYTIIHGEPSLTECHSKKLGEVCWLRRQTTYVVGVLALHCCLSWPALEIAYVDISHASTWYKRAWLPYLPFKKIKGW